MISETTLKTIKKYVKSRYKMRNQYVGEAKRFGYTKRLRDYEITLLRRVVKLDNTGWPTKVIYPTGKIKTDVCQNIDERLDLSECVIEIFNGVHLEIRFMSNGTYIS